MKPVIFIVLMLFGNTAFAKEAESKVLRDQYLGLKSPKERLLFCIDLIDKKVIARGVSYEKLKGIFGDKLWVADGRIGIDKTFVYLHFSPQTFSKDETEASSWVGWYLYIEFGVTGKIRKYWLSDLHK